jgi:uncharacterized protein (TIGR02145 family)
MKRLFILTIILCFVVSSFSQQKGTFIDNRDGKVYKTIQIGTQTWLAENLAFKTDEGNFWVYENDQTTVNQYGYFYDYETAKNVCPSGWKLPAKSDFQILLDNWGSDPNDCFSALISNGNSGFSALLGGVFAKNKLYDKGKCGVFWSSSEKDISSAYTLTFTKTYYEQVDRWFNGTIIFNWKKIAGVSVRCIKD